MDVRRVRGGLDSAGEQAMLGKAVDVPCDVPADDDALRDQPPRNQPDAQCEEQAER